MAKELADPHRPLQRRFWMIERVGWVALTLIIIWAVAGGTGGGILADARVQSETVTLGYEKYTRRGLQTPFKLEWSATPDRDLSISFDSAFVDRMKIDFALYGLQPVRVGNTVTINLGRPAEPGRLLFVANPVETGQSTSAVRVGQHEIGRLSVFVFP